MKKLLLSAIVALGFTTVSFGDDFTGSASATLQSSITLVESSALNFGKFSIPTTESTVSMTEAGVTDVESGDIVILAGSPQIGLFTVSADKDTPINVSVDATFSLTGGDGLCISTSGSIMPTTTDAAGKALIKVFGLLTVPTGATSGEKTGTYTVTVNY